MVEDVTSTEIWQLVALKFGFLATRGLVPVNTGCAMQLLSCLLRNCPTLHIMQVAADASRKAPELAHESVATSAIVCLVGVDAEVHYTRPVE